jgi:hypothetical protein
MGVPGAEPVPVPFKVQPDLGGEWGFAVSDQRHRMVLNGIWDVGHGFQLSSVHYTGLGNRSAGNYGGDRRNLGGGGEARLRPDGTIVPRNAFMQPPQHRTDVRFQQKIRLGQRRAIDVMAEAFNVFNRPNWTLSTQESSADYNKRVSGQFRTMQFGFRLTF